MLKNIYDLINIDISNKNISSLNDELKCIFLMKYFEQGNSILFVANSLYEANYIYKCLSNYTSDVLLYPMDDFLTSEALAVSPELKITRLESINEIIKSQHKILITNLVGYLQFLPLKINYLSSIIKLKVGESYKTSDLVNKLFNIGYTRETILNRTGEIAVRGFVIDIFPVSESNPVRIEFWGDEIDSIRVFNVDNQLTINNINCIDIYPNTEIIINSDIDHFGLKNRDMLKYGDVCNITSYFDNCTVFYDNFSDLKLTYTNMLDEMTNYSISINIDSTTKYMYSLDELVSENDRYFNNFSDSIDESNKIYDILPFKGDSEYINDRLDKYIKKNKKVVICLSNRYIANKLIDYLNNTNVIFTNLENIVDKKINIIIKKITSSFMYNEYVLISENDIFNKKTNEYQYKTKFKIGTRIRNISKLSVGDYVVHQVHGIGKYLGIKVLTKNGIKKDYLTIEYKDGDKLYIPVEKIDYISKYSSNEGLVPKISKLGGTDWTKTKIRVREKASIIAKDLLKLYAEREKQIGYAFKKDSDEQIDFEKEFTYQPTIDQLKITDEVKKDMEDTHPMDRLVCGDVGFGKTEIAFRAIFKAIMSNKQVAFLCPTTILSQQHYQNAIDRFKSFPVNIAILNRFVSPSKIKETLDGIKKGKIDLLIGTHRILSDDVEFKNLGLLVIDEEQRFGVKHKEKIKKYKNNIDVLTLSATPIPRTLQMSIAGLRSLSLLETPPSNRYPVQTYVLQYNNQIIKDAIYKELSRNGQVFVLFNNIKEMDSKLAELQRLVPQARIVTAHGQMNKVDLENIMYDFINYKYDILLCTTIIETGIDIPNVNTLIILDADYFGLSQLYQIRGRVGRSNKIAYCYLMYSKNKILNEIAIKRLKVIKEFTELGSGFSIAMRDLSIRGAGNILGSEQSGYIDSVGIELFMKMLKEEINRVQGQETPEKNFSQNEPLIAVETNISDKYVEEADLKIEIHRKINEIDSYVKLQEIENELKDRFGTIPDNIIIYMYEEWFEKIANKLDIKRIVQNKNSIEIYLPRELTEHIDGEKLFNNLYDVSKMFRLSMKNRQIVIVLDTIKLDKHFIYYLIDMITAINNSIK